VVWPRWGKRKEMGPVVTTVVVQLPGEIQNAALTPYICGIDTVLPHPATARI